MATAKLIETHKNGAEIYHGGICKAKMLEFLDEITMPKGLIPVDEIEEFGINRNTGFMWLKMRKKTEKKFKKIGNTVMYNVDITCFFERGHMSKVTGVKAKELLVPVVINDIRVENSEPDHMIKFTAPIGLARSHPITVFEVEDN